MNANKPTCKSLLFVLAMDIYEKYKVITEECANLITSLSSFIKDIEFKNEKILSGQKQVPIPGMSQKQREYFYALRAVYNIQKTAQENIDDFILFYQHNYKNLLKTEGKDDLLFDFIAKRDCMTTLAKGLMAQLKNYQLKLIQQREQSPPVSPLPDIFRRFNISAYSIFISDYSRMMRYQILDFVEKNTKKDENADSDFFKDLKNNLKYNYISNIWEHSSTSRFFNAFVNYEGSNKDEVKDRNFMVIKNTYWFLEFPIYLPLIVHEIAHVAVNILIKKGKKNVFSTFIKFAKSSLMPLITAYEDSPNKIADMAETICTEILVDIISFYMLGVSYIFALFLQIVGIGNHLLFKRLSTNNNKIKCSIKDQYYDVLLPVGVPWKIRINVLVFLYDNVTKKHDNKEDSINNSLIDEIKFFLKQYEKSGEKKYYGSKNLYNKFNDICSFDKLSTKLLREALEKTFLKKKVKHHYYYRTNLSEICKKSLEAMLNSSRNAYCKSCFKNGNKVQDQEHNQCNKLQKSDIENSINKSRCLKLEDVAWETTFSLARLINNNCENFKETFFDKKIDEYPSGKRSFFLVFTSYNFRNQFFLPPSKFLKEYKNLQIYKEFKEVYKEFKKVYKEFKEIYKKIKEAYKDLNEKAEKFGREYKEIQATYQDLSKKTEEFLIVYEKLPKTESQELKEVYKKIKETYKNLHKKTEAYQKICEKFEGEIAEEDQKVYEKFESDIEEAYQKVFEKFEAAYEKNNKVYEKNYNTLVNHKYYKDFFDPQKHFSEKKLNSMLEKIRKDFPLENSADYIDFAIEKEILEGIIKPDTGMNLCVLSLCRKDLREGTLSADDYIQNYLKTDKNSKLTAGTLFGYYDFFVLQEKYYPNSNTLVWHRKKPSLYHDFPYHTKSKLLIEVKLSEGEPSPKPSKDKQKYKINALIRCRCKNRGQHLILLNKFKNEFSITKKDRFFISGGWEDIVILLCQKDREQDIVNFINETKGTGLVDRIETIFMRKLYSNEEIKNKKLDDIETIMVESVDKDNDMEYHLDDFKTKITIDENQKGDNSDLKIRFYSLIKLKNHNFKESSKKDFIQNKKFLVKGDQNKATISSYYGKNDYIINWNDEVSSLEKMVNILENIETQRGKSVEDVQEGEPSTGQSASNGA